MNSIEAVKHHRKAAEHFTYAAKHHTEAGNHCGACRHEQAAREAYLAHGHCQSASNHAAEAARLHTRRVRAAMNGIQIAHRARWIAEKNDVAYAVVNTILSRSPRKVRAQE